MLGSKEILTKPLHLMCLGRQLTMQIRWECCLSHALYICHETELLLSPLLGKRLLLCRLTNVSFYFYVSAVYNWKSPVPYCLPLEIGDTVQIMEENSGIFDLTVASGSNENIFTLILSQVCGVDITGSYQASFNLFFFQIGKQVLDT